MGQKGYIWLLPAMGVFISIIWVFACSKDNESPGNTTSDQPISGSFAENDDSAAELLNSILKQIPDSEFVKQVSEDALMRLSWSDAFDLDGQRHAVLIYSPMAYTWPGSQPIAIFIVDSDTKPLCWKIAGGIPVFTSAQLRWKDNRYLLSTFSASRRGGTEIETFSISASEIKKISHEYDRFLSTGFPIRTFDAKE